MFNIHVTPTLLSSYSKNEKKSIQSDFSPKLPNITHKLKCQLRLHGITADESEILNDKSAYFKQIIDEIEAESDEKAAKNEELSQQLANKNFEEAALFPLLIETKFYVLSLTTDKITLAFKSGRVRSLDLTEFNLESTLNCFIRTDRSILIYDTNKCVQLDRMLKFSGQLNFDDVVAHRIELSGEKNVKTENENLSISRNETEKRIEKQKSYYENFKLVKTSILIKEWNNTLYLLHNFTLYNLSNFKPVAQDVFAFVSPYVYISYDDKIVDKNLENSGIYSLNDESLVLIHFEEKFPLSGQRKEKETHFGQTEDRRNQLRPSETEKVFQATKNYEILEKLQENLANKILDIQQFDTTFIIKYEKRVAFHHLLSDTLLIKKIVEFDQILSLSEEEIVISVDENAGDVEANLEIKNDPTTLTMNSIELEKVKKTEITDNKVSNIYKLSFTKSSAAISCHSLNKETENANRETQTFIKLVNAPFVQLSTINLPPPFYNLKLKSDDLIVIDGSVAYVADDAVWICGFEEDFTHESSKDSCENNSENNQENDSKNNQENKTGSNTYLIYKSVLNASTFDSQILLRKLFLSNDSLYLLSNTMKHTYVECIDTGSVEIVEGVYHNVYVIDDYSNEYIAVREESLENKNYLKDQIHKISELCGSLNECRMKIRKNLLLCPNSVGLVTDGEKLALIYLISDTLYINNHKIFDQISDFIIDKVENETVLVVSKDTEIFFYVLNDLSQLSGENISTEHVGLEANDSNECEDLNRKCHNKEDLNVTSGANDVLKCIFRLNTHTKTKLLSLGQVSLVVSTYDSIESISIPFLLEKRLESATTVVEKVFNDLIGGCMSSKKEHKGGFTEYSSNEDSEKNLSHDSANFIYTFSLLNTFNPQSISQLSKFFSIDKTYENFNVLYEKFLSSYYEKDLHAFGSIHRTFKNPRNSNISKTLDKYISSIILYQLKSEKIGKCIDKNTGNSCNQHFSDIIREIADKLNLQSENSESDCYKSESHTNGAANLFNDTQRHVNLIRKSYYLHSNSFLCPVTCKILSSLLLKHFLATDNLKEKIKMLIKLGQHTEVLRMCYMIESFDKKRPGSINIEKDENLDSNLSDSVVLDKDLLSYTLDLLNKTLPIDKLTRVILLSLDSGIISHSLRHLNLKINVNYEELYYWVYDYIGEHGTALIIKYLDFSHKILQNEEFSRKVGKALPSKCSEDMKAITNYIKKHDLTLLSLLLPEFYTTNFDKLSVEEKYEIESYFSKNYEDLASKNTEDLFSSCNNTWWMDRNIQIDNLTGENKLFYQLYWSDTLENSSVNNNSHIKDSIYQKPQEKIDEKITLKYEYNGNDHFIMPNIPSDLISSTHFIDYFNGMSVLQMKYNKNIKRKLKKYILENENTLDLLFNRIYYCSDIHPVSNNPAISGEYSLEYELKELKIDSSYSIRRKKIHEIQALHHLIKKINQSGILGEFDRGSSEKSDIFDIEQFKPHRLAVLLISTLQNYSNGPNKHLNLSNSLDSNSPGFILQFSISKIKCETSYLSDYKTKLIKYKEKLGRIVNPDGSDFDESSSSISITNSVTSNSMTNSTAQSRRKGVDSIKKKMSRVEIEWGVVGLVFVTVLDKILEKQLGKRYNEKSNKWLEKLMKKVNKDSIEKVRGLNYSKDGNISPERSNISKKDIYAALGQVFELFFNFLEKNEQFSQHLYDLVKTEMFGENVEATLTDEKFETSAQTSSKQENSPFSILLSSVMEWHGAYTEYKNLADEIEALMAVVMEIG